MKAARHEIFDIVLAPSFKVRSTVYCTVYSVHCTFYFTNLQHYCSIINVLNTVQKVCLYFLYLNLSLSREEPDVDLMIYCLNPPPPTPRSLMLQLV